MRRRAIKSGQRYKTTYGDGLCVDAIAAYPNIVFCINGVQRMLLPSMVFSLITGEPEVKSDCINGRRLA